MTWIVVDVEADGPCPGLYSMVSLGAVVVEPELSRTFKGLTAPVSDRWDAAALAISRISRAQHEAYPDPAQTMADFKAWLDEVSPQGQPVFVSDNPAFDWQFVNYYFHRYQGANPFGYSARRIGDLYAGWKRDLKKSNAWKKLRKTEHTHDPLDDAKGNAEALLAMKAQGLALPLD
jgi:DNA polymerase III epsilon subunit-like protein